MKRLIIKWVILAVAIIIAAKVSNLVISGFDVAPIDGIAAFFKLMIGAAALSLINMTLGKILKFLTFPITCLTLGLSAIAVNAAMLYVAGSLELGFKVDNFWAALVGSVQIAIINGLLGIFVPDDDEKDES